MQNFWQKLNKKCKKQNRPILALAPMAGLTDFAFRQICRNFGADVVYTEMTSVDALYYRSKKTFKMLKTAKGERPAVLQLFGRRPEYFAEAAKIAEEAGFAGIDINFGCPAPKVARHGGGIKLLRDLNLCYEIIVNTVNAVKIPVSVKTRTMIAKEAGGSSKITAIDFTDKIKDLPVAALMIHGRSYEQGFKGGMDAINVSIIKEAAEKFNGITLANGAVRSAIDAEYLWVNTKTNGIGIAQGAIGHPWLFKELLYYFVKNKELIFLWPDIKKTALKHSSLANAAKGKHGIIEMRKHLALYVKNQPNARTLRSKLVRVETIKEIKQILKNI